MKIFLNSAFIMLAICAFGSELPFSDHPYGLCAADDRLDELCQELEMPLPSASGLVQTMNYGGGFMLIHLDSISFQFIEFAKTSPYPVLDIGSAFGVATIPALKQGNSSVIANDIGADNLLILRKQVDEQDRKRLYLNTNRFPQELNFSSNSLGCVLICRVLHFLRGEEIEEGLKKIFDWLVPGGKLFIITATPYLGNLKEFVDVYESRWADGVKWPGYVENFGSHAPGLAHNLNPFLHVMDERPLRQALESAGFEVETVEFIDRRSTIPTLSLDGKEGIGVIAVKPKIGYTHALSEEDSLVTSSSVKDYFKNFEILSKAEKWESIISQGNLALEVAQKTHIPQDEAKICAQLTSTAFYMGDYNQALVYANRCHELSKDIEDPTLFIRVLYLESAIYRALASKNNKEEAQQASYLHAIQTCEKAASIYSKTKVSNVNLKGKIYFNLGAAHADNPKGDLEKASNCYLTAIECFKKANAIDDVIRTSIRLGKVHLLQKNYTLSQQNLDEIRPLISNERLSMHADYLEAQLKFATHDIENALIVVQRGLKKAKNLNAKEDELRLKLLLQAIEEFLSQKF